MHVLDILLRPTIIACALGGMPSGRPHFVEWNPSKSKAMSLRSLAAIRWPLVILPAFDMFSANGVGTALREPERPIERDYEQGHEDPISIITGLCREMYRLGWVTGTGGGISLRQGRYVYMAPSGVQKERLRREDIFILDADSGQVLHRPERAPALRVSQCCPLFFNAFRLRNAGACIHTHSPVAVMATMLPRTEMESEFRVTHLEMIKGLPGYGYHDTLTIPLIDNTAHEEELADAMAEAMKRYARSPAVLVRRHGLYAWGRDYAEAKTITECLDYLFDLALRMHRAGLDYTAPPKNCVQCQADGRALVA
jgi:methylthioribulose-1-phosphate dehydratase